MKKIIIKCPECKEDIAIEVPKNACVAISKCDSCGKELCTKEGECCVICSYGTKKCKDLIEE